MRETRVIKIVLDITTDSGTTVYSNSSTYTLGEGAEDAFNTTSGQIGSLTTSRGSLMDLSKAWNNRTDIRGLLSANPLQITMTLIDVVTSKEVTVQDRLSGAILGTVYSTFENLAMKGVAQLVGITAVTPGVMVGMSLLSAVFSELTEMALGLDNSFGFGGELNVKATEMFGQKAYEESKGFLGVESFADYVSFALGFTDMKTVAYENIMGVTLGYGTTIDGQGFGGDTFSVQSASQFGFGPQSVNPGVDWTSFADIQMSIGISEYSGSSADADTAANAAATDAMFGTDYSNYGGDYSGRGGDGGNNSNTAGGYTGGDFGYGDGNGGFGGI